MKYFFEGIPADLPEKEESLFRSRIDLACQDLIGHTKKEVGDLYLSFGRSNSVPPVPEIKQTAPDREEDTLPGSNLSAVEPKYRFEQLVLPQGVLDDIQHKISLFQLKNKVFEEWGLKEIEPYPRSALNFHGAPGTGKTMAAHAIAQLLGKKIILATYAEIESKYHGDGPKNVKAVFKKAEEEDAIDRKSVV